MHSLPSFAHPPPPFLPPLLHHPSLASVQQVIQDKRGRAAAFHVPQPARGAASIPPSYVSSSSLPCKEDDPEAALLSLSASELAAEGTKPGALAAGANFPADADSPAKGHGQRFVALEKYDSVVGTTARAEGSARGEGGRKDGCVVTFASSAAAPEGDDGCDGSSPGTACYTRGSDGSSRMSFKNVRLGVFHFRMRLDRFATSQEVAFKFARVVDRVCGAALFVAYAVAVVVILTLSGSK